MPLWGVIMHAASRGMETIPMLIQRSRSLLASTSCAIALGMACSRAHTPPAPQGALHQPAAENNAPLVLPPVVDSASKTGAGEEATAEKEGATPGNSSPMPVLNQLLTTQALLVSLLLAPVTKAPPEPAPVGNAPAPPRSGSATQPSPGVPISG